MYFIPGFQLLNFFLYFDPFPFVSGQQASRSGVNGIPTQTGAAPR